MPDLAARLARVRVPIGFVASAVALWLAHPTWGSIAVGGPIAVVGEVIRVWAAGHLEKGREVTKSGPYRVTGHPLYLGSSIIGIGFAVATYSLWVVALAIVYLGGTLGAAIRSEEASLRAKFGREYVEYRQGRTTDATRRFSLARAMRNREYRAIVGLAAALILLVLKAYLML
ncbi:MAG TPA: isoprenylcysteine carboxylmethyltransferase family protein [Vicinamibacterales bacterium]|jgi:protein-S-isoprenylcysteine O-methyltransferase Ste14